MKLQTPFRRAAIAATLLGGFYLFVQPVDANLSFSVDGDAPLAATLLPTVSVTANASGESSMQLSNADPLPVTLLPTVHVTGPRARSNAPVAAMRVASVD